MFARRPSNTCRLCGGAYVEVKMLRQLLFFPLALFLTGCAENNPVNNPLGGAPDLDLFETAVRHLLPRAEAVANGKRPTVYVELPDAAPAAEFCRRFDKERVPVLAWPGVVKEA